MSEQRHDANQVQGSTPKATESRFDRRRFLRTSAAAAPVLLAVKSPKAWAVDFTGCTASTLASVNTSSPHNECQDGAVSPGGWHSVFSENDVDWKNWILQGINNAGYYNHTPFNDIFLSSSAVTSLSYNGWMAVFDTHTSDNPTLEQCLPVNDQGNSLNGVNPYKIRYKLYPQGHASTAGCTFAFDVAQGAARGSGKANSNKPHTVIVAGLLNSLFAPGTINYSYHGDTALIYEVQESIRAVLRGVISSLVNANVFDSENAECSVIDDSDHIDNYPLESLKSKLEQW